jgi:hypothetical protein
MKKVPSNFVPLASLRTPGRTPRQLIDEIRRIYFKTSERTIHDDLAHAIALLQAFPTEEDRDKAAVYMEGLTEMRSEWAKTSKNRGPRKGR